jgi:D-glycero-D-manno-heptose 1,7-bisphosphate phosphatase
MKKRSVKLNRVKNMRVVFLDRDGVINKFPGNRLYVTSLKKFRFLPGAKKAIALLSRAGYTLFIASNQAGVGRGIYSQKTLDAITSKMLADIRGEGGDIRKVFYCTHRKEAGCPCRKPRPGMLKMAAREFGFDLRKAYFVGDTIRDVLTAKNAGCKSILVLCGREKLASKRDWEVSPDLIFNNLNSAAKFVISQSGSNRKRI